MSKSIYLNKADMEIIRSSLRYFINMSRYNFVIKRLDDKTRKVFYDRLYNLYDKIEEDDDVKSHRTIR